MKLLKNIFICAAIALFAISCDELEGTKVGSLQQIPVMNQPSAIVIDDLNKAEEVTLSWTPADFGYNAAVTYSVYGIYGSSDPFLLGTSTTTSMAITKDALNLALFNAGAPENENVSMMIYVVASIAESYNSLTSASVGTIVKTTTAVVVVNSLFAPGAYQGWAPATAPQVFETSTTGVYEGFIGIYGSDLNFKFTTEPDWDHKNLGAGTMASGTMTFSDDSGAGNLLAPQEGFYHFYDVDENALTGKYEVFDALVVVGDFQGWSNTSGVPMTYDVATNTWSATVDFSTGSNTEFLILPAINSAGTTTGNFDKKFALASDGSISFAVGGDGNFSAPAAQSYVVKINFNESPYTLTFE